MHLGWNVWTLVAVATDLFALTTAPSVLLRTRQRPTATLGWLLALFTLPLLGPAVWWLIGRNRLERRRVTRSRSPAGLAASLDTLGGVLEGCGPSGHPGVGPRRPGNQARLLVDAAEAYPVFFEGVAGAVRSVDVLFFSWQPDETGSRLRDHLAERAAAGVDVRVLVDGMGAHRADRAFFAPLLQAGGRVAWFQPPRILRRGFDLNFRNHRKLLMIDRSRAWIGGLNIGDEHLGAWHDLAAELRGPVVRDLFEVFADDWFFTTGEALALPPVVAAPGAAVCRVLASGPDDTVASTHDAFFLALTSARTSIRLMTPYFIPGEAIVAALRSAALRGVDVRLLLPASSGVLHDRVTRLAGRTWFPELLDPGIRIWEYGAGFLHAKALVVDEELTLLGSANLDSRSFRLNFELSCAVHDKAFATRLGAVFDEDLLRSNEVVGAALEAEPLSQRIVAATLRLAAPLL